MARKTVTQPKSTPEEEILTITVPKEEFEVWMANPPFGKELEEILAGRTGHVTRTTTKAEPSIPEEERKEHIATITEHEFEERLRKVSRALHGIRNVLWREPDVDAIDIASILIPIDDQLVDFLDEFESRFGKGGAA
jgi:23S rRNA A1618 N6-methylase RlmF